MACVSLFAPVPWDHPSHFMVPVGIWVWDLRWVLLYLSWISVLVRPGLRRAELFPLRTGPNKEIWALCRIRLFLQVLWKSCGWISVLHVVSGDLCSEMKLLLGWCQAVGMGNLTKLLPWFWELRSMMDSLLFLFNLCFYVCLCYVLKSSFRRLTQVVHSRTFPNTYQNCNYILFMCVHLCWHKVSAQ